MPENFSFPKDKIDPLILPAVEILNKHGFKTFESCQGGEGHCFAEPTVRFEGTEFDLIRAHEVCEFYGLPVSDARRVYRKISENIGENTPLLWRWDTPFNELTFLPPMASSLQLKTDAAN
jgi:hypothetical protein